PLKIDRTSLRFYNMLLRIPGMFNPFRFHVEELSGSGPDGLQVVGLMRISKSLLFFSCFPPFFLSLALAQETPTLVKDIYVGEVFGLPASSLPSQLTPWKDNLYFAANDGVHGIELWRTDGTDEGTQMVRDINIGEAHSSPSWLEPMGDYLYFTAKDATRGIEIWRTDGTEEGTILVADIFSGPRSSEPQYLTAVNDLLFFSANQPSVSRELWISDGESSSRVADINPAGDGILRVTGQERKRVHAVGDLFFFRGTNGRDGLELFASDGGSAYQVRNINQDFYDSEPYGMVSIGDTLYFAATERTTARELYRSDGTEANTKIVKDIYKEGGGSPDDITRVGDLLYFSAFDADHGFEVWESDGTAGGTRLVGDIRTGDLGSSPSNLTDVSGTLYFAATDGSTGKEPWTVCGPGQPAVGLADIRDGAEGSDPNYFTFKDGFCYFAANDGIHGDELWKTNGSIQGTTIVADIQPDEFGSKPSLLTVANGILFFRADDGNTGFELWRLSGSTNGGSPPEPPTGPGATGISKDTITWTWNDQSLNEFGFNVFRDEGASAPSTHVQTTGPDTESWTDQGLLPNTLYTFQVNAFNDYGSSDKTDPFSAWSHAAVPLPPVVSNIGDVGFDVSIASGDENPETTEYAIALSQDGGEPMWLEPSGSLGQFETWQLAANWGTQSVTGLTPGSRYEIRVKARNGSVVETLLSSPVFVGDSSFPDLFEYALSWKTDGYGPNDLIALLDAAK
ncbi:MAG: fibronectin type III domain-containing protein, partial [Candidatus Omnitrophica bacterium]|nr:fibronectin type III domain-containing protein [Candidatus Omnitrophota bacterium]